MNPALGTALFEGLPHTAATERLGWALLHFVWQGALFAVLYGALRLVMRRASARTKYWVATVGMFACALSFAVTLVVLPANRERGLRLEVGLVPQIDPQPESSSVVAPPSSETTKSIITTLPAEPRHDAQAANSRTAPAKSFSESSFPVPWREWLTKLHALATAWLPWIVPVWLLGVLLLGGRVFVGWRGTVRLRRETSPITDIGLLDALESLRRRLHLPRSVQLLASRLADSPLTLGWWRPVILMPVAMLSGVDARTMEFMLAHELAHVRRWDYLVNWIQVLVETLLFFHPVVWWLGHDLRQLREECCDDLAITATGDRAGYARALVSLEELRASWPGLAPAARGGSLLERVRRLLPRDTAPGTRSRWGAGAAILAALAALTLGLWQEEARAEDATPAALIKSAPHGVVLDATGKPVPGCRLWLRYEADGYYFDYQSKTLEEITTDGEGRFQFKSPLRFATLHGSIQGECFSILARKDGVGVASDRIAGVDPDGAAVTLRMEPVHPLKVRVQNGAKQPVSGATVWLTSTTGRIDSGLSFISRPAGWVEAVTDRGGNATLEAVPDSAWAVGAMAPLMGTTGDTRWAHLARANDKADMTKPLTITLAAASRVGGVVVDPQGVPVARLPVLIERTDNYWREHRTLITDAAGRFHIDDLSPYRGKDPSIWRVWATGTDWTSKPITLELKTGEHREDLSIPALPGTLVRGRTSDPESKRPIAGASIRVLAGPANPGECRMYVWSDAEGNFAVRVPPGGAELFLENLPSGWCTTEDDFYNTFRSAGNTAEEFVTLDSRSALRPLAKVRGRIDPPQPGARIHARVAHGSSHERLTGTSRGNYLHGFAPSTRTNEKGEFEAAEWPTNSKMIVYCRTEDRSMAGWTEIETGDGLEMKEPIRMGQTASLRVRVIDAKNKPMAKTVLDVFPVVNEQWLSSSPEVTTDKDGLATLVGILPGLTYEVRDSNQISCRKLLTLLKELPADQTTPTVEITLRRPEDEQFTLTVRDGAGQPVTLDTINQTYVHYQKPVRDSPSGIRYGWQPTIAERKEGGVHVLVSDSRRKTFPDAAPFELRGTLADGSVVTAKGTVEPESSSVEVTVDQWVTLVKPPVIALDNVAPDEIAGRVVDPAGKPIADAKVTLRSWTASNLVTVLTGQDGVFRGKPRFGTEEGRPVVYFEDGWMRHDPNRHPFDVLRVEKEGFATGWVVNANVGEPCEVRLDSATRLKGRFTAPDGSPLRDMVAVIITRRGSFRNVGRGADIPYSQYLTVVRKSEDGTYDWQVEPGYYTIELRNRDGMCALVRSFEIKAGTTQAIPATFAPGRNLRIQIVDPSGRPLPGVEVSRGEQDGGDFAILHDVPGVQTSDADGWVTWPRLPPWKGSFSIFDAKLKRCPDDTYFLRSKHGLQESQLGENESDKNSHFDLDLTRVSETFVRVQRRQAGEGG